MVSALHSQAFLTISTIPLADTVYIAYTIRMGTKATKLVRLDLALADHQRVRVAAAKQGLSMAEFARRSVMAALAAARKMEGQK